METKKVNSTNFYKKYGKIEKIKRNNLQSKIQKITFVQKFLGIFAAVAFFVLAFWFFKSYFIPSVLTKDYLSITQAKENELISTIKYDSETGLPVYENEEVLFLVNKENPLDDNFKAKFSEIYGIKINEKMEMALFTMTETAKEEGIELQYSYGYINKEVQEQLYQEEINKLVKSGYTNIMAKAKADFFVSKPGESDSETGFCVTIKTDDKNFDKTKTYNWLVKNSNEYGFVFRYPENKETITGHVTDLTTLRYVGTNAAISMRQLDLCFEEYINYIY